ncbi:hypothetical protein [Rhizobium sp. CF142]|uniref:hypothetical protein n=1 Tax=Rhizobium sp. CF142 TaxID=1144314 RepID=UPI0005623441|nr:hypothetical protein [Rhizobium sp. CF142]
MEASDEASGSCKLGIIEVAEIVRHMAGNEAQHFALLIVHAQEAWHSIKATLFEVKEKTMHMRPVPRDRAPDGIPDPDHASSNATAGQRGFFRAHPTRLAAIHEGRNGPFAKHGAIRVSDDGMVSSTAAWGFCRLPDRRFNVGGLPPKRQYPPTA